MTQTNTVMSMTGFAQTAGQVGGISWRLELKSVNGKGFDLRTRTPAGFDVFEATARTRVAQLIKRGSLTLNVQIGNESTAHEARINRPLLTQVLALAKELSPQGVQLDQILAVRGIIETDESELEASPELLAALQQGLEEALPRMLQARAEEGAHLKAVLTGQLDAMHTLTEQAAQEAAQAPVQLRDKLQAQLRDLGDTPVSDERLAQEVALLATRADVREELDRLNGHIGAVRKLLQEGGPVGRKLDFMCQELNREANTLCSKSTSLPLTNIGVELKVIIEQFREQVQNVE